MNITHITLEIQVLVWYSYKYVAGFNRLPISTVYYNTCINQRCYMAIFLSTLALYLSISMSNKSYMCLHFTTHMVFFNIQFFNVTNDHGYVPLVASISAFMTFHSVCNQINTICDTSGEGTANPSVAPEFIPFQCGSCYSIFSFRCMVCRSLFVSFLFFFWPLCCLSFFNLRILISSNSSYSKACAKYSDFQERGHLLTQSHSNKVTLLLC